MSELTDQQVLTKCVEIAVENGWKDGELISKNQEALDGLLNEHATLLIFDHDFAKALFGEGWHFNLGRPGKRKEPTKCDNCGSVCPWFKLQPDEYDDAWIYCWQANLQQLAIAEDRINYLRKWIND